MCVCMCVCVYIYTHIYIPMQGFLGGSLVRNPPANIGDSGLIPGSGTCPRGRNSNPLPYSCLKNSMDSGAWLATVCRAAKNQTQLTKHEKYLCNQDPNQSTLGVLQLNTNDYFYHFLIQHIEDPYYLTPFICPISFYSLLLCCAYSLSHVQPLRPHGWQSARMLGPWGFSRQEYWSGLPCPPPRDLLNPGIKPRSPISQEDSLPTEPPGKPRVYFYML